MPTAAVRHMRSDAAPFAGALLMAALQGCAPAPPGVSIDVSSAFADPQLVRTDVEAPATLFDGAGGSLIADTGWSRPRRSEEPGRAGFVVDAVGARSRLLMVTPRGSDLEFLASCRALDGASEILVSVEHGGAAVAAGSLGPHWSTLRARLSASLRPGVLDEIWLTFRPPGQPGSEIPAARRERPHWASCAWLAVAPAARSATTVGKLEAAARTGPGPSGLRALLPGMRIAFPIAPGAAVSIYGDGLPRRGGCAIDATLSRTGSSAAAARLGLAASAPAAELANDSNRAAELQLELSGTSDSACDGIEIPIDTLLRAISIRAGSTRPRRVRPPNLIVYSVDTLRADAITPETTPNVLRFAADAARWTAAVSPSSWTIPSVASLLTGVSPARHGVLRWDLRLAARAPATLAELLKSRGYRTVGISHSWIVGNEYGLDRGFDDFYLTDHFNGVELRSQEARGMLRAWLLENLDLDTPFFAFVHTVDPHGPYSPPQGPFSRAAEGITGSRLGRVVRLKELESMRAGMTPADLEKALALYRGEVSFADQQFGRFLELLKVLDLYENSVIAFTSDHGEEFLEHGGFDHGKTLYREVVEVPLVVRFPAGLGAGRTLDQRIATIDLPATLAKAGGAESPEFDGADLRRFLAPDAGAAPEEAVFLDLVPNNQASGEATRLRAAILRDTICQVEIRGDGGAQPRWRFFRPEGGWPEEGMDADAAGQQRCREVLLGRMRREAAGPGGERWNPDEETMKALRAVGYLR